VKFNLKIFVISFLIGIVVSYALAYAAISIIFINNDFSTITESTKYSFLGLTYLIINPSTTTGTGFAKEIVSSSMAIFGMICAIITYFTISIKFRRNFE
jgi:hypothetical protein